MQKEFAMKKAHQTILIVKEPLEKIDVEATSKNLQFDKCDCQILYIVPNLPAQVFQLREAVALEKSLLEDGQQTLNKLGCKLGIPEENLWLRQGCARRVQQEVASQFHYPRIIQVTKKSGRIVAWIYKHFECYEFHGFRYA